MAGKKVLIVDDSATDRYFFMEALSKQGYECITAQNGDEAIEKSKSEMPDVILMDIVMPGIDGYKAPRTHEARSPDPHSVRARRLRLRLHVAGLIPGRCARPIHSRYGGLGLPARRPAARPHHPLGTDGEDRHGFAPGPAERRGPGQVL